MKCVNSLISLKWVIFLFYGAIGCLFPYLLLHMKEKNLNVEESKLISLVAPCIAVLGPLIAGILADRYAGSYSGVGWKKISNGKYLRIMIAICFILSAILYWLLELVPPISKKNLDVLLVCDHYGGNILQETCGPEKLCHEWDSEKTGSLLAKNCTYTCYNSFSNLLKISEVEIFDPYENVTYYDDANEEYDDDGTEIIGENANEPANINLNESYIPHPHLCYKKEKKEENLAVNVLCEVFTKNSLSSINLEINLKPSMTLIQYDENEINNETQVCSYPIGKQFECQIPAIVQKNLLKNNSNCQPIVICQVDDSYGPNSILKESQCGYDNSVESFWTYLLIRSVADIFPAAAVALLSAAIVIATRETSTGRGDVGKQLACGALGLAIFAPIVDLIGNLQINLIIFSVLLILATIIILFDWKMPLSPPEWWWQTRCGLVALPLSSIRKYNLETIGLAFVLLLLGILWNGLDSFLPWYIESLITEKNDRHFIIGFTVTVGALPAVVFLFFAEKIVDYCGHTNLLIASFCFYVIHYIGLNLVENAHWILLCEALEIFTLHVLYATAVMYLRHIVSRRFTVLGQTIPIIFHFCIGRAIGGVLISAFSHQESFSRLNIVDIRKKMHAIFAIAALVFAIVYFLVYHCYLRPRYEAPLKEPPQTTPPALIHTVNGNGSYTPLRVYHNGRAKKGQFRF